MNKTLGTKIEGCNCKNNFQDERYGKGKRVFNLNQNKTKPMMKCTVCGTSKPCKINIEKIENKKDVEKPKK